MNCRVFNQDCLDELRLFEQPKCRTLVITSPPYKDSDGYSWNLLRDCFNELYRIQHNGDLFFLNFGHLAEDKFRPFEACDIARKAGYKLNETFVWVKNHYKPIQGTRRVNNLTEFIFLLYKVKVPKLNRLAVGIPYADKSNIGRFAAQDLKCAGNVWYIDYETITRSEEKLHNDRFPVELPERCMKLANVDSDTLVLDPFAGSGTTGVAALNCGCSFIGYEINSLMATIANDRLFRVLKNI